MNDQLKKYVQDNRDGFDHLEPSPVILDNIKKGMKPSTKTKSIRLFSNYKWKAAAIFLISLSISYVLFKRINRHQPIGTTQLTGTISKLPDEKAVEHGAENHSTKIAQRKEKGHKTQQVEFKNSSKRQTAAIDMASIYTDLLDSSSASIRLSAVLKIQKSQLMSYDMIDKLAKTLNHDPNSNVRLAVLDLLGSYASDAHITNLFVHSITNQKDPLVQLGLIKLLAKTNDTKLDEKLYALANDPGTITEVKDQDYMILLNQNKL
jgi:hypothetical protein